MRKKECGAKTRSGGPCKTKPMPNGRCRMHGGKSLSGENHPRWKHGRYAVTTFDGMLRQAAIKLRKRERSMRKEESYVNRKLCQWVNEQLERRGTYNVMKALRLATQWRNEYREKYAPAHLEPLDDIEFIWANSLNPVVEGLRAALASSE